MSRAPAPPGASSSGPPAPSTPASRARADRQSRMGVVSGILTIVLILGLMQLWLLTATMNAFLGGDHAVAWPALGASAVCLLLNLGLLRYLYSLERSR